MAGGILGESIGCNKTSLLFSSSNNFGGLKFTNNRFNDQYGKFFPDMCGICAHSYSLSEDDPACF
jgi:hypothetical protein